MSQPPEQPPGYPYPGSQPPGGYGLPPQSDAIPGQYQPTQYNPYAQPPGAGGAGGFGPPGAPGIPGQPQTGGRSGGGKRFLLGTLVGLCAASALWAGGVFGLGLFDKGDGVDLGSYQVKENMCPSVDLSAFKDQYSQDSGDPQHKTFKHKYMDTLECNLTREASGSTASDDSSSASFEVRADYHKKTDPTADFTATWEQWGQEGDGAKVAKVTGLGDQAYLVTQDVKGSSTYPWATMAVRDGSVVFTMSWSVTSSSDAPTPAQEAGKLKAATAATMRNLRS